MKTSRTGIRVLESGHASAREFRTGVSLHCHTEQSKEILDFIPYYASKIPLVAQLLERELEKHKERNGETIDFARAYWTPPIHPRAVLEAESEQIQSQLGLDSIVSITDHDHIGACTHLQVLEPEREIPISFEWTVPFSDGFFHVGVHNLPRERATEIWSLLMSYTKSPRPDDLAGLFDLLGSFEQTLIVLNHPLWDIERLGEQRHIELLTEFLTAHQHRVHAIEVNGFRSWAENKKAIELANRYGFPIVSGGDRHGHEPNAVVNLTAATTFSEFACEIREDRISEVAVLPAYKEPLVMRMLEAVGDVLKYYPAYPWGQRYWTDRIFWTLEDGTTRPLSFYWKNGGPAWVRASLHLMRLIGSRRVRPAMRLVFAREEGVSL